MGHVQVAWVATGSGRARVSKSQGRHRAVISSRMGACFLLWFHLRWLAVTDLLRTVLKQFHYQKKNGG